LPQYRGTVINPFIAKKLCVFFYAQQLSQIITGLHTGTQKKVVLSSFAQLCSALLNFNQ
jgi:hypothetical protein